MNMTTFTLCKENKLPIKVFNMNKQGNLFKVSLMEKMLTLVDF